MKHGPPPRQRTVLRRNNGHHHKDGSIRNDGCCRGDGMAEAATVLQISTGSLHCAWRLVVTVTAVDVTTLMNEEITSITLNWFF